MKRVSFNVAKAIKNAGYPQDKSSNCYNADTGEFHYTSCSDNWLENGKYIDAPTYLDVWLWLWREKKIHIEIDDIKYKIYDATEWVDGYGYHLIDLSSCNFKEPEEAIKNAIEYLVKNDLIK